MTSSLKGEQKATPIVPGSTGGELRRGPLIEEHGMDVIAASERRGKPRDLFWPWSAATVTVLGVSYGGFALAFGIGWVQAIVATVVSLVLSCLVCGVISIAGKRGSAPTLVLSRAAFGITGNRVPAVVSWLLSVGWETISCALAALATATVFGRLGWSSGPITLAVALVVVLILIVGGAVLGYDAVMKIQTWIMYISIVLTVVYIALTLPKINFSALQHIPSGGIAAVIGATILLMTGGGLGWVNAAADYSRYLPRSSSSRGVAIWTTLGLGLPPLVLIIYGVLLAGSNSALAAKLEADPIGALAGILPLWYLVPFALVAVLGLVGTALLEIYSSGLSLLSTGVKLKRPTAAFIDGVIMAVAAAYIIFWAPGNFFTEFEGVIITLGVPISAWAGIMIADIMLRKRNYDDASLFNPKGLYGRFRVPTLLTFAVATVVGFGFVTNTAAGWLNWQGYFMAAVGGKAGLWAGANLGVIMALVLGFVGYVIFQRRAVRIQESKTEVNAE
jgi:nucleobase:cation symporter-1, NCS1 family